MSNSQQKCEISSPEWYKCPIPTTIFVIFLFLFIYSIIVLVKCTSIITDKQYSTDQYNQTLYNIFMVYIVNLVITFISLLVIMFFLYKLLPTKITNSLFNDYIGMTFMLYIFIISCWTLHLFNNIKNINQTDVQVVSGLALSLSLIAIILYIVKIICVSQGIGFNYKQISTHISKKLSSKPQQSSKQKLQ
jgi:hypothetical protein